MTEFVRHVVIVGGGSAGWLTAGVIAAEHRADAADGLRVTLVESPDVATIGVGEGTWPTMRDTLRNMGVSETAFLRECDASFKQGSKFAGWVDGGTDEYYYHPFVAPQGYGQANLAAGWRERHADVPFADLVSCQPHLCERGRAPKQRTTPEFAAVANYAYHLDAAGFGRFLRAFCTGTLGVEHIVDHVTGVTAADNGDIASVATAQHGDVGGDLFIDCTGMGSLLIGKHYGIPFLSRRDVLFNDTALAARVPYADADGAIASHTIGTAQSAGWIWDIGLPSRRGVGYVYSSAHTSEEDAHRVLACYIEETSGGAAPSEGPRRIAFEPGHRQKFWHRNCVAVGMSAGFIEPLEASALVLVELSAAMIRDELPATRELMELAATRFNERFRYRWDRVVEFLKLHYVLSRRDDSAYWRDNRRADSIPGRLAESLSLWRYQPPSRNDFYQIEEVFPAASYQYVLYGMDFEQVARPVARRSDDAGGAEAHFRECRALTGKMLAGLPDNRQLLDHVREHGLQRL